MSGPHDIAPVREVRAARPVRGFLVGVVVAFVFGGADQYLGSRVTLGPWAYSVSAMSAPWLLLAFIFGATQGRARRAAVLGLTVTVAALAGYFALTLSPLEGVALRRFPGDLVPLAHSQLRNIAGGLVTGPLFGFLGHRWRTTRAWSSAVLVAAAFCLEPLARAADRQLSPPSAVWVVEIVLGAAMAAYFMISRRRVVDTPR